MSLSAGVAEEEVGMILHTLTKKQNHSMFGRNSSPWHLGYALSSSQILTLRSSHQNPGALTTSEKGLAEEWVSAEDPEPWV